MIFISMKGIYYGKIKKIGNGQNKFFTVVAHNPRSLFYYPGDLRYAETVDEGIFSMGQGKLLPLEIAFGIVEIICGIVLLFGVFLSSARKYTSLSTFIILIIWLVRIIITRFVYGLTWLKGSFSSFMIWLLILSVELFIAAAIFVLHKRVD